MTVAVFLGALLGAMALGMPIAYALLVCGEPDDASSYRAFTASGAQGVNYRRDAWHHPLLVLDPDSRFMVVDRKGPGNNLVEHMLSAGHHLTVLA